MGLLLGDEEKKQCSALVYNGDGTYGCSKFHEIINGDDLSWVIAPAFGAGCCSA